MREQGLSSRSIRGGGASPRCVRSQGAAGRNGSVGGVRTVPACSPRRAVERGLHPRPFDAGRLPANEGGRTDRFPASRDRPRRRRSADSRFHRPRRLERRRAQEECTYRLGLSMHIFTHSQAAPLPQPKPRRRLKDSPPSRRPLTTIFSHPAPRQLPVSSLQIMEPELVRSGPSASAARLPRDPGRRR